MHGRLCHDDHPRWVSVDPGAGLLMLASLPRLRHQTESKNLGVPQALAVCSGFRLITEPHSRRGRECLVLAIRGWWLAFRASSLAQPSVIDRGRPGRDRTVERKNDPSWRGGEFIEEGGGVPTTFTDLKRPLGDYYEYLVKMPMSLHTTPGLASKFALIDHECGPRQMPHKPRKSRVHVHHSV